MHRKLEIPTQYYRNANSNIPEEITGQLLAQNLAMEQFIGNWRKQNRVINLTCLIKKQEIQSQRFGLKREMTMAMKKTWEDEN